MFTEHSKKYSKDFSRVFFVIIGNSSYILLIPILEVQLWTHLLQSCGNWYFIVPIYFRFLLESIFLLNLLYFWCTNTMMANVSIMLWLLYLEQLSQHFVISERWFYNSNSADQCLHIWEEIVKFHFKIIIWYCSIIHETQLSNKILNWND